MNVFEVVQGFPNCLCCAGCFLMLFAMFLVSSGLSRLVCGLLYVVACVLGGFTLFFDVLTMCFSKLFSTCVQLFQRF